MRLLRWLLLPVLFLALPAVADEPVRLAPGEQKVIEVPGVRRIAIAAPDIADVKTLGKSQLLITGQRRGRTTLTLWTDSKQIQRIVEVDAPRAEDLTRELKAFGFDGVEVRTIGEKLVINGHVDSLGDMRKLRKLVEGRSDVTLLVGLDPRVVNAALTTTAEQINKALQHNGITAAKAMVVGQRIMLEGSVSDDAERDKAQRIADSFYDELREALGPH